MHIRSIASHSSAKKTPISRGGQFKFLSSNLGKCGVFEIIRVALLILRLDVIQGNLEENLIACRAGDPS